MDSSLSPLLGEPPETPQPIPGFTKMKLELFFDEFYPHPCDDVWRALTDPTALSTWMMPNDFEPHVGRRFSFKREALPPNTRGTVECEVLALEPPSRMVWSWLSTDEGAPTRVEFRL